MVARVNSYLATITRSVRRRHGLIARSHDRYLLEELIFAELSARRDVKRVLFVGCDSYTEHYADFFPHQHFVTMDVDPAKARYGAQSHLVDDFARVDVHFPARSLDAVICNGVIGWGLDRPEEIDRAAQGAFQCLRPGGIFVVGWNDIPPWRPAPFHELDGFRRFRRLTLPPFPTPVYPTLTRLCHVYSFYARPAE